MLWEVKGSVGDAVHNVERDPLDLLTVEHDKVVFEDQERVFRDQNETLLFIVPMIHPENIRGSDPLAVTGSHHHPECFTAAVFCRFQQDQTLKTC